MNSIGPGIRGIFFTERIPKKKRSLEIFYSKIGKQIDNSM
jgi:hypothetical protein